MQVIVYVTPPLKSHLETIWEQNWVPWGHEMKNNSSKKNKKNPKNTVFCVNKSHNSSRV